MTDIWRDPAQPFRAVPRQGGARKAELLLRDPQGTDWLSLAGTARRIWELLEYPATLPELAAALGAEYEADRGQIEPALREAAGAMVASGLVEPYHGPAGDRVRERYLGLLKRAVANLIYPELELDVAYLEKGGERPAGRDLQRALRDIRLHEPEMFDDLAAAKQQGRGLRFAHTMVGMFRLHNLERCAERVFAEGIEGDFLEAGVCRGGAAIFMRGLQVAHGEGGRRLWVVDSFEGVPPSVREEDRRYGMELDEDKQPWLACDMLTVREHFRRYGLLDPEVRFVPGWLQDTLPGTPIGPLALLRLDVDLYSATADCLDLLYDKVSPGGFVVVDDYGFLRCCRDAVDAFRERRGIKEPIEWIDYSGIWWRKGR